MKGIKEWEVKEIERMVKDYKKLKDIYNCAIQKFDRDRIGYGSLGGLFNTLDKGIEEIVEDIGSLLNDLYQSWAGLNRTANDFDSLTAYYVWEDAIQAIHRHGGVCGDLVGIDEYVYASIELPKDFISEFIKEFGLFEIEGNDLRII